MGTVARNLSSAAYRSLAGLQKRHVSDSTLQVCAILHDGKMLESLQSSLGTYYEVIDGRDVHLVQEALHGRLPKVGLIIMDVESAGRGLGWHPHSPPVLMLGTSYRQAGWESLFRLGIDDYVLWPEAGSQLLATIDTLLGNHKSYRRGKKRGAKPLGLYDIAWLKRLEVFIREVVGETGFHIGRLALHMAMSERQIYRRIKELTGLTPNKYVREVRLQVARELLEGEQSRTIGQLAYAVGFEKPDYFSSLYKARFGRRPC